MYDYLVQCKYIFALKFHTTYVIRIPYILTIRKIERESTDTIQRSHSVVNCEPPASTPLEDAWSSCARHLAEDIVVHLLRRRRVISLNEPALRPRINALAKRAHDDVRPASNNLIDDVAP